MHGKIRQQRDRLSIRALHRQHGKIGIGRAGRAHRTGILIARMHIRPHRQETKRVHAHLIGRKDPAAAGRVFGRFAHGPADAGRLQVGIGLLDCPGQQRHDEFLVLHVRVAA